MSRTAFSITRKRAIGFGRFVAYVKQQDICGFTFYSLIVIFFKENFKSRKKSKYKRITSLFSNINRTFDYFKCSIASKPQCKKLAI